MTIAVEVLRVQLHRMGYNSFTEFIEWLKGYDIKSYNDLFSKPDYKLELKFRVPGDTRQAIPYGTVESFEATAWQILLALHEERKALPLLTFEENRHIKISVIKDFNGASTDYSIGLFDKLDQLTQWKK